MAEEAEEVKTSSSRHPVSSPGDDDLANDIL